MKSSFGKIMGLIGAIFVTAALIIPTSGIIAYDRDIGAPENIVVYGDTNTIQRLAAGTGIQVIESYDSFALVKADGKYYVASKEIKVTLGGCGG